MANINEKRKFRLNIFLGIINSVVSALQTFWFIPYIKDYLGSEAYGYVSVVNGLINTLMIISVSVGVISTRFIVINLEQGYIKKASHYFSSEFYSLLIVGLIIALIGIIVSFNLTKIMNISSDYYQNVQILFLMTLFSFLIQLVAAPFSASFYTENTIYITYIIYICDYSLRIIMTVLLFRSGHKVIWSAALATDIVYIGLFIIYFLYTKVKLPELVLKKGLFKLKYVWNVLRSGTWVGISYAGNTMLSSLTTYFSNILCGVFITGIYSAIMQLNIIANTVLSVLVNAILPKMFKLYANENDKELFEYILGSMELITLFVGMISGGIIIYGTDFMKLWMGNEFGSYGLLIVLTVFYLPFTLPSQAINQVFTVKNKVAIPAIGTLFFGILNVLFAIFFTKYFKLGIVGIALGSCLVQVIRDNIFYPLYLKLILKTVNKRIILPVLIGGINLAVDIVICCLVKTILPPKGLFMFIISVTIAGILLVAFSLVLRKISQLVFKL